MILHDPLHRSSLPPDPLSQLRTWLADVAGGVVVTTLSTVDDRGHSRARVVPLRAVRDDQVEIHTDLRSAKGIDLGARPAGACLLAAWPESARQIRLDVDAVVAPDDVCDAVFATRPRGAQLRAWVQAGTGTVSSRAELEHLDAEVTRRWADEPEVPRPPTWAVVLLTARSAEVFQGAADGCHDRFRYHRAAAADPWTVTRLVP